MIEKDMNESKSGFIKHLGGLKIEKINNLNYKFSVKVQDIHLNTSLHPHGGFLASIADSAMGTAAHDLTRKRCVTISLNIKFISAAKLDDNLEGTVIIEKKTNTLVFINCNIKRSNDIVVSVSGIWKILK